MTNEDRKPIIRDLLAKGRTLSEIQDHLRNELNDPITYMELRLLLADIPDATLPEKHFSKIELPKDPAPAAGPGGVPGAAPAAGGKLSVSVDQLPQPGAMLSGFVRFSSGAKAHWLLDAAGRLGLEPELGSGKATAQDMQEFTTELRRLLQQG